MLLKKIFPPKLSEAAKKQIALKKIKPTAEEKEKEKIEEEYKREAKRVDEEAKRISLKKL